MKIPFKALECTFKAFERSFRVLERAFRVFERNFSQCKNKKYPGKKKTFSLDISVFICNALIFNPLRNILFFCFSLTLPQPFSH